jgi:hypothetical protein
MTLKSFSGVWEKVIHEKNLKQKSRDTVPSIQSNPESSMMNPVELRTKLVDNNMVCGWFSLWFRS